MKLCEVKILPPTEMASLGEIMDDPSIPDGRKIHLPKKKLQWVAYAKYLHNKRLMPPEKIKPFIMSLQRADVELTKGEIKREMLRMSQQER